MSSQPDIRGRLVAKNSALSFVQMLIPVVLAFVTIPYVIHRLGLERFGVLSLVSVLMGGYANVFDLGMGRATTYFVTQSLGRGEHDNVPRVAFSSLCVQVAAGLLAGSVFALLTPLITTRVLHVSVTFQAEARLTFWLAAASLPLLGIFRNFRSVLEAYQRFDLITAIQVPSSSANLLLPAVGAWVGLKLPGIMLLLIISRLITIVAYLLISERVVPRFWRRIGFERRLLPSLFKYGGWVALCDAVIPVINYSDRFVVGSVLSLDALGYYAAPFDAISKTLIVPSALVQSLFPALGTVRLSDRNRFTKLYAHGLKYTMLAMTPMVLFVVLFSRSLLQVWVGSDFALKATVVLQFLAVGMLFNAIAQVACTLLDAAGRPDLRARVFLSVVVPSFVVMFVLTRRFGVNGTAAGWLMTAGAQAAVSLWLARRVLPTGGHSFKETRVGLAATLSAISVFAAAAILLSFKSNVIITSLAGGLLMALFIVVAWNFVLDRTLRRNLFATIRGS